MYSFKENEIVILLGAGASVDANIPYSAEMISRVETLVDNEWQIYKDLYNFIKSSIYYSDGIRGKFDSLVNYNIERFVNTLDEIKKKHQHILYPFVGSWNPMLIEVAGNNFEKAGELSKEIVKKLRTQWIALKNPALASYYRGLQDLQKEYAFPLRVFSLNYDLCVEENCSLDSVERGFTDTMQWDWRQYDESIPEKKAIYLYKLHGSTDWYYDENDILMFSADPSSIEDAAIIFGTSYKFQYKDPFLFLAYEFRRWTLASRLILCIGYGFGDDHINQIIHQALKQSESKLLLAVAPFSDSEGKRIHEIETAIGTRNHGQIKVSPCTAKGFMENEMNLKFLSNLFPMIDEDLFPVMEEPVIHRQDIC